MAAKGTPLTDDERQRIIELLHAGHSRAAIARQTARSVGTIANVAASIGFRSDQSAALRTQRAREARSAYSAERRAQIAAKATERAMELLEQFDREHLVFSFGGRDNTYAEHTLPEPPVDAKRQMAAAFRDLMRTVLDVDRHDNRAEDDMAAVDQWLRGIVEGAAS